MVSMVVFESRLEGSNCGVSRSVIRQSEFLEDLVPDVPRIFSIFGVIVGRLVAEQGIPMGFLADICQPLVDSPSRVPQAPKLLKPVFEEVLRADADAAPGLWEESELDLKSFWPGATGTDEAIAEWIQSNGLEAMFSGSGDADADGSAEVAEDALKQFIADAQSEPDALAPARLTSLLEALGAEQLASESVVSQIVGAVVRNAAQRTAQAQPEPPAPSREQYSEQRDTIKNHQKALMDLLPAEKSALRSVACSAIQDVCEELGYPSRGFSLSGVPLFPLD